jgi:lipopolysaccharide export system protein LptA
MKPFRILTFVMMTLVMSTTALMAQKQIDYESDWGERLPSLPDDMILKGNVVFHHEGMVMYCDSAVLNQLDNKFSAFGIIDIYQNDTIHITGDVVYYDGNLKIAEIMGKVVTMEDGKTTLITDYLVLERIPNIARYTTSATIYDQKDTLTSIFGTYFLNDKIFHFTDKVHIITPSSEIFSDTIHYNTKTDVAEFFSKTTIVDKDSTIINTDKGNYNTTTSYCESYAGGKMTQKGRLMLADTLFYDSKERKGEAFGSVYMEDTANNINAMGEYANMQTIDTLSYTYLTQQAIVKQVEDGDTLYFHADTLLLVSDTSNNMRNMYGYRHSKLFRSDFQAAAEYAHYHIEDSLLTMTERPILWNEESQMTADTITMLFAQKKIDRMQLYPNALIVQDADSLSDDRFNQMYGRHLTAYFNNGRIKEAEIEGNAQSIYYMWEEKKGKAPQLIGINIGNSSKMKIYFEKGKMKRLVGIEKPEYKLDNEDSVPAEERRLKGFIWKAEDRPLEPDDIFKHRL